MIEVCVTYLFSPLQIYFGNFPAQRFTEITVKEQIEKFKKALSDVESEIRERNKHIDIPYEYMLPSKTPNSITI